MANYNLSTVTGLFEYLATTPYAAADESSVQTLSGGHSGFSYRVVLREPLVTGETSVVVKHVRNMSPNPDWTWVLKADRMDFEREALDMVGSFCAPDGTVQVPRVLHYDREIHALIMSDIVGAQKLSTVLIECIQRRDAPRIRELGSALGDFMGRFHQWTSLPGQAGLRARFLENEISRDDVFQIRWELTRMTVAKYGLGQSWMKDMIAQSLGDAKRGGNVIAMADFWFDNILVVGSRIYIVDWETTRCARAELDIGQFATAAYSLVHVWPMEGFPLMDAFLKSYGAHMAVDMVQLGVEMGRDMLSFGVMMPWVRHLDDSVKEAIARAGMEILAAGHGGDVAVQLALAPA